MPFVHFCSNNFLCQLKPIYVVLLLKDINMCLFEVTALSGCLVAAWLTLRLRIEETPIS
jgi:hypothetical protein